MIHQKPLRIFFVTLLGLKKTRWKKNIYEHQKNSLILLDLLFMKVFNAFFTFPENSKKTFFAVSDYEQSISMDNFAEKPTIVSKNPQWFQKNCFLLKEIWKTRQPLLKKYERNSPYRDLERLPVVATLFCFVQGRTGAD